MSNTSLTKIAPIPEYLKDKEVLGLATINKVVAPPALVIVQAMSQKLLDAGFKQGDLVLLPAQELAPDTISVIPLFFYTEFAIVNPRDMKDLPMIRERSFDEKSEIAQRCRDLEEFPCPENEKYMCRYQATMTFVVWCEELQQVATLRFSRSEYKTGRIFASKIKARRRSIFASRYTLQVGIHKNDKGRWNGFDFKQVDPEALWVDEDTYNTLETMHLEISKAHADNLLVPAEVDIDDVDDTEEREARF
jgi:hypothetical protein